MSLVVEGLKERNALQKAALFFGNKMLWYGFLRLLNHLPRYAMLKNPTFAAIFSTAYLVVFAALVALGYSDTAAAMFILSPLLVVWMTYIVLRYGEASGRTFDEYYYDDVNIRADKWRE